MAFRPWKMFQKDLRNTGKVDRLNLLCCVAGRYVFFLNPDGSEKTKYDTGSTTNYQTPAIKEDGTVYIGSYGNRYIHAINPDGSLKWKYLTGGYIVYCSPAIAEDGTIYAGSNDDYIYALNPDGTVKWKYLTGGDVYGPFKVGKDGTVYTYAGWYLYAINPDGSLKWKYFLNIDLSVPRGIAVVDGTIYVNGYDTTTFALNTDGTLKWTYSSDFVGTGISVGPDGTVYFGDESGYFYAINPDGSLKWKYYTGFYFDDSCPAIFGDRVVASDSNSTFVLSPEGELIWSYGVVSRAAPIVDSNGNVYIGGADNYLYKLDVEGNLAFKKLLGSFRYGGFGALSELVCSDSGRPTAEAVKVGG